MPFVLPALIAVPIAVGFLLGGPLVGFFLAVVIALVIVTVAVRVGQPRPAAGGALSREAARRFLIPLAIAMAGIAVIAFSSGTLRVIGWGIVAIAVTLAISLVFLEIGYSEDRARRDNTGDPGERPERDVRPDQDVARRR